MKNIIIKDQNNIIFTEDHLMDLFLTPSYSKEVEKTANKQISNYGPDWSKEIFEFFFDSYPELINSDTRLVFKAKEVEKGYGIGSIYLNNLIAIPFIIENFSLYPLDVAITMEGKYFPFNRNTLNTFMSNPSAFQGLKELAPDEILSGVFDRNIASNSIGLSPAEKTSSFIDKVAEFIPISHIKKTLAKQIQSDDNIKLAFSNNELAKEVFAYIVSIPNELTFEETVKTAENKIDRDIYLLTKTGTYKWNLRSGSSEFDEYTDIPVNEEDIDSLPLYKGASSIVEKEAEEVLEDLVVLDLNGTSEKICFNKKGEYKFVDNDVETHTEKLASFNLANLPSAGDTGMFVIDEKAVTNPLTVLNTRNSQGHLQIEATDGLTKKAFTLIRPSNNQMWADNNSANHWLVPGNAQFIKLAAKGAPKVKKSPKLGTGDFINHINSDNYEVFGPILSKYAESHGTGASVLDKNEMLWTALHCGANSKDMDHLYKMGSKERYELTSKLKLPVKIAEVLDKPVIIDTDSLDFTKIAAFSSNSQTVDAMLSLNFLNKETLQDYYELIPMYEEAMSSLAKLLLSIRLGYKQIPEKPTKDAMNALATVIYVLKGLKRGKK